jgi:two-component system alkaline phosphatase synthesis response regulator PhoP
MTMDANDYKVLLVDDEKDILEFVSYNLKKEGFRVFTANNGQAGLEVARAENPHIILLDVMMPGMDGIETCDTIRSDKHLKNTLVAFLTARGEDYSQVAGLDAGADDYITKPIKPKVLISRVKALLRRYSSVDIEQQTLLEFGKLTIDLEKYQVRLKGKKLDLPRKEFELLRLLSSRPGKVFNRDEILDSIWGNEVVVGGRTIDVHIRKLREKLGDGFIKTVKGVGYKFEV